MKVEHLSLERPRHRRDDPDGSRGKAAPQILHDRLAIDCGADRLAHCEMLQHWIAEVEPDVRVVGAGRRLDAELSLLPQLPHDVRRDVIDDEVHSALTQLQAAHRVVGDNLQDDAVVSRRAAEVLIEPREHDAVVRLEGDELVRSRADRRARVRRA